MTEIDLAIKLLTAAKVYDKRVQTDVQWTKMKRSIKTIKSVLDNYEARKTSERIALEPYLPKK